MPGDWNTQDDCLLYYEGTVWYRRKLRIEAGRFDGRRVFLHVGAANHTSRVFLDGDELAMHAGGFGPFAVDLTGRLAPGEHSIVIQVDNRREPDRIPAMRSDWWNFGGLTRSVELVAVPETFLRHAWITMASDGQVVGGTDVEGESTNVRLRIPSCGVDTMLQSGERFELAISPQRWGPGRPLLHDVTWTCGDDELVDTVGFRTVRTEGEQLLVNDHPVFLRGIATHAEAMSDGRRSHGLDDARAIFDRVDDLGADFVRLAHYQHDEHMVREADRRGILAWCELPVYWGIAFDEPYVLQNALEQLDELIVRDRSRASVVFWSVANETLPSPERTSFLTALAERARTLDPTRLVSAALLTLPTDDVEQYVDDPLGEVVDVIAVNEYLGWYYGDRSRIPETRWSTPFDKPIVFTELGAGAKAGHRGGAGEIWTEEFQRAVYEAQLSM
ncbi:MAG: glycoside hydrolase family 2 TIM barrel-domain containing protein, partial [Actinomycetota bacterium]